jgi:hypothetical protein
MTVSELYHFINAVIERFREAGLDPQSLEIVQNTAYTTSSEWLGELGLAVRMLEKQIVHREELRTNLETILKEVHRAWPNI